MIKVRAKKHLGQHFLKDKGICEKIVKQITNYENCSNVIEIGPGMGALSDFLIQRKEFNLWLLDIDSESVEYLKNHYPQLEERIILGDFLRMDLKKLIGDELFFVVGNFPYNISTQILFRCLEFRNQIPQIVGMFQKEVAVRLAEKPGSKDYGITSVLFQTFYDIHYCFTVDEHVFIPPPKVKSGVIRCTRNNRKSLSCDERLFFKVVKMAFNQRRKTLRNSLKQILNNHELPDRFNQERPEKLSVDEFIELTQFIQSTYLK